MDKIIITEAKLNRLIGECIEEVMLEEGFKDTMGKVWNGVKQAAGNIGTGAKAVGGAIGTGAKAVGNALGRGISKAVTDPVGAYGSVRGWIDQTKSNIRSRYNDAYNMARDRVRAQTVDRDPWKGYSPEEKNAVLQVRGRDEFGNWKYSTIRYAKKLKANGHTLKQIVQIMNEKGFKGIDEKYARKLLNVGKTRGKKTQTPVTNGEMSNNPDTQATNGQNTQATQQTAAAQPTQASTQNENIERIVGEVITETMMKTNKKTRR